MGTWANFAFGLPILLSYLFIQGIPSIDWWNFIWATLISYSINFFAWYLFFRSLQSSPLSHTMPFSSFTPIFLIPVAFIIIGELPSIRGILGIILIFVGGYIIHLQSGDILSPIKNLKNARGTRLMLLVAFLWSITATFEKVAVLSSSQAFYGTTITLLLTISYLPFILRKSSENWRVIKNNWSQLALLGIIFGLMVLFQFTALKYLLVSYVIAFKRSGIIISVLVGIMIYREKSALKNLVASAVMILGVFLILS